MAGRRRYGREEPGGVGDQPAADPVAFARENLAGLAGHRVVRADVQAWLAGFDGPVDAVVLDPPRDGAGADVIGELHRLRPSRVAYVACDPVSLARDLGLDLVSLTIETPTSDEATP